MQAVPSGEIDDLELARCGAVGSPVWACHPRPAFHSRVATVTAFLRQRPEIIFFVVLILVFNAPVFFGQVWQTMVFQPDAVRSGQWWRLFTHPFVHLTWYHLLLDGTAFLSLYCSLLEKKTLRRIGYVVAAATGSLIVSWAASSATSARGLCGLSGVAHGLMAVSALEMIGGAATERKIGCISFLLLVAKAGFEAATGRMFFGFLSFGLLGEPVAVSHAGGILGGLIAMLALRRKKPTAGRVKQPVHSELRDPTRNRFRFKHLIS